MKDLIQQLLVPPGYGVYTVNTAKERKDSLTKLLYGNQKNPLTAWSESLRELENSSIALYGICSDTGGGILRGANWGPLFLRSTFYQLPYRKEVFDLGDIRVIPHLLHDKYLNQETIKNCRLALFGNSELDLPVSPLSMAETFAHHFHQKYPEKKLIMLGGDHSVSYPVVKAYLENKTSQNKKCAIIHFDAHTDLLDHRLGIDICFGSWAYPIKDLLASPELLIQIGIRSSGKERGHWESKMGVTQFWSDEVYQLGPEVIAQKISSIFKKHNVDEIYISFDIDALDEKYASATGTPEPSGLHPQQCHYIINTLSQEFQIGGADLVEVAPMTRGAGDSPQFIEPHNTLLAGAMLLNLFIERM